MLMSTKAITTEIFTTYTVIISNIAAFLGYVTSLCSRVFVRDVFFAWLPYIIYDLVLELLPYESWQSRQLEKSSLVQDIIGF